MYSSKNNTRKIILLLIILLVLSMGIVLFIIPPAVFPDAGWGLQVLRSMHLGSGVAQLYHETRSGEQQCIICLYQ
jgi:disulfide bond formation protein DsbB